MLTEITHQAEGDGLTVLHVDLPDWAGDGLLWPKGGRWYILVRYELDRPDAAAVVAHELAHWRRGIMSHHQMPESWGPFAAREETACNDLAAAMLIDLHELRSTMIACDNFGYAPTVHELAAEHEVPAWLMERAVTCVTRSEGIISAA